MIIKVIISNASNGALVFALYSLRQQQLFATLAGAMIVMGNYLTMRCDACSRTYALCSRRRHVVCIRTRTTHPYNNL